MLATGLPQSNSWFLFGSENGNAVATSGPGVEAPWRNRQWERQQSLMAFHWFPVRLYDDTKEAIKLSLVTYNTLIDVPLLPLQSKILQVISRNAKNQGSEAERLDRWTAAVRDLDRWDRFAKALVQSGSLNRAMELFRDMARDVGLVVSRGGLVPKATSVAKNHVGTDMWDCDG